MACLEASDQIGARGELTHLLHVEVLDLEAFGLVERGARLAGQIEVAEEVGHVAVLDVEEGEQRVLGGLDRLEYLVVLGLYGGQARVQLLVALRHLGVYERRLLGAHAQRGGVRVALVRLEVELGAMLLHAEHRREVVEIGELVAVRVQVADAAAQVVHGELATPLDVLLRRHVHVDALGEGRMEAEIHTLSIRIRKKTQNKLRLFFVLFFNSN